MELNNNNYFSKEAQQEYCGASQYKQFKKCEAAAMAEINGDFSSIPTTPLLVGSYVDAHFEGALEQFCEAHPEIYTQRKTLRAEYQDANAIIERVNFDAYFMSYLSGEKQVIMTGEIEGVPVKVKIDCLLPDKIVDLKIMRDFNMIWSPEEGRRVSFVEYWGYDLQGAIYQEIVRQNTGKVMPFFIAGATKETVTDFEIISIDQNTLDNALQAFKDGVGNVQAIKLGIKEPERCGRCDYCKQTKVLTAPIDYLEVGK